MDGSIVLALVIAMTSSLAMAEGDIVTLEDRGGIKIQDLIEDPDERAERESLYSESKITNSLTDPSRILADGLYSEALYPVVSESLRVGPIGNDEAADLQSYLLTMPMFIIGYDRVSVNWMLDNLDILEENKAVGLVVNVETPDQMREIVRLTQGRVALQPTPGDDLAQALNLRHYPAYIDHQGIVR